MKILWTIVLLASSVYVSAASRITVGTTLPTHRIPSILWGIFFEDINFSADGGLYPERVRNRSFEDANTPECWTVVGGEAGIDTSKPLNSMNPQSLRVNLDGTATLVNEGYWGMNMVQGDGYVFKLAARSDGFTGPLTVTIQGADGKTLASGAISGLDKEWNYYSLDLIASGSDPKARLQIIAKGRGTVFLDMVSLLPKKTWKGHGLRIDLAESINALKPAFFRFPGGCWVEGDTLETIYRWKTTIGDIDSRTPLWNLWEYHATQGLGYHEYLQLAEDLGTEPIFCINAGMAHFDTVPMGRMGEFVQDALDAIEYANGPIHSLWGGLRAKAGHPEPFNLKYLEIGNESGGADYNERWPLFVEAIQAKYPEIRLIANEWKGNVPEDPRPEILDVHYYNSSEWFMQQANHFDDYDRNGPKIYVGEYAATRNCGKGNLYAALGEAAFMTGIERNSDIVSMACYAPLFVNLNHRRWNPDLINFDSSGWYGSPSYYVQQLFAEHSGSVSLATQVETGEVPVDLPAGGVGIGTWNTQAEFKDIKVTASDGQVLFQSDFSHDLKDWTTVGDGQWSLVNGVLRQSAQTRAVRAITREGHWTDYTLELKARKRAGDEGFLVLFRVQNEEDYSRWNIGGWGNTLSRVDMGATGEQKDIHIKPDRWYDIKLQVNGWNVKCWLDGERVHDVTNTLTRTKNIYAHATRDETTNDIVLKVVNTGAEPTPVDIILADADNLASSGTARVLASDDPRVENSLAEPCKVSPQTEAVEIPGPRFTREFPAYSFTVLRLPAAQ